MKISKLIAILIIAILSVSCGETSEAMLECDAFEELSDQGSEYGSVSLAHCYRIGQGRDKDLAMAEKILKNAAKSNSVEAMHYLAYMYLFDFNSEMLWEEAITLLEKASDAGYSKSQFLLGVASLNGMGVEIDDVKARDAFATAAENGHPEAAFILMAGYCRGVLGYVPSGNECRRSVDGFFENSQVLDVEEAQEYLESIVENEYFRQYIFSEADLQELQTFSIASVDDY